VSQPYTPGRGDLVWINFDPQAGHEQAGHRPALVVSPASYNGKVGLARVCPIKRQAKGYPFEVPLPADSKVGGVVLADQVKSLDWRVRRASFGGRAPDAVMEEVTEMLGLLIQPN
jgi:mRNA interferase MazF